VLHGSREAAKARRELSFGGYFAQIPLNSMHIIGLSRN
jgi:hypothetical protein